MPSKVAYFVLIILVLQSTVIGQSLSDLGMMGGSAVVLSPTTGIYPASHFRIDAMRLSFLRKGSLGLNGYNITTGLSPNIEFYAKFQLGETKTVLSQQFIGLGGKFVLPFTVPYFNQISLWSEFLSTAIADTDVFYPASISRYLVLFNPAIIKSVQSNILVGVSATKSANRFYGGMNASFPLSQSVKLGGEFDYGYYNGNDKQEFIAFAMRILPNLCLQVSPGYYHASDRASWIVAFGLSFSTAEIDYIPQLKPKETIIVPSIDEMEKQLNQEKKKDK